MDFYAGSGDYLFPSVPKAHLPLGLQQDHQEQREREQARVNAAIAQILLSRPRYRVVTLEKKVKLRPNKKMINLCLNPKGSMSARGPGTSASIQSQISDIEMPAEWSIRTGEGPRISYKNRLQEQILKDHGSQRGHASDGDISVNSGDPYLGEQLAAQSPESAAKMLEQEGKTLNAHQKESKRHGHQAGGITPRSQRAADQAAFSPQFIQTGKISFLQKEGIEYISGRTETSPVTSPLAAAGAGAPAIQRMISGTQSEIVGRTYPAGLPPPSLGHRGWTPPLDGWASPETELRKKGEIEGTPRDALRLESEHDQIRKRSHAQRPLLKSDKQEGGKSRSEDPVAATVSKDRLPFISIASIKSRSPRKPRSIISSLPGQSIEQSEQALAAPSTERAGRLIEQSEQALAAPSTERAGRLIEQREQALAAASSHLFKQPYAQAQRARPQVLQGGDQPVKHSSLNLAGLHQESASRHVEDTVAAGAMAGVTGEVQEARELEKQKGIHVKRRSLSPPSGSPRKQQHENSTFHRKKVTARPMSNGFLNIQALCKKSLKDETSMEGRAHKESIFKLPAPRGPGREQDAEQWKEAGGRGDGGIWRLTPSRSTREYVIPLGVFSGADGPTRYHAFAGAGDGTAHVLLR